MVYLNNNPTLFTRIDDVPQPWPWKNFTPEEMCSKGNGSILIVPTFMDLLQHTRDVFNAERMKMGLPEMGFIISSAYRDPKYNDKISSTGLDGPHTKGKAVDIKVHGAEAWALIAIAGAVGFTGCGVAQKLGTPYSTRYVHLDTLTVEESNGQRPHMWGY